MEFSRFIVTKVTSPTTHNTKITFLLPNTPGSLPRANPVYNIQYLPNRAINTQSIVSAKLHNFDCGSRLLVLEIHLRPCLFLLPLSRFKIVHYRLTVTDSPPHLLWIGYLMSTGTPLYRFTWSFTRYSFQLYYDCSDSYSLPQYKLCWRYRFHNFQFPNALLTKIRTCPRAVASSIRLHWCVHNLLTCRSSFA